MGRTSGDCDSLITEVFDTPVVIQTSAGAVTPYKTKHYLYCYPNPVTKDTHGGKTFTPRRTRLVVEAELGSHLYYYPIDIVGTGDVLKQNTSFVISKLTITGPGVENPDDELKKGTSIVSINVELWKDGFSKEVTY